MTSREDRRVLAARSFPFHVITYATTSSFLIVLHGLTGGVDRWWLVAFGWLPIVVVHGLAAGLYEATPQSLSAWFNGRLHRRPVPAPVPVPPAARRRPKTDMIGS